MLAHINHLRSLHDQLKEMGETVNDKELAMTVLASLPDEFKPLITALDAVGEDNLSYEKVKAMLLNDVDRATDTKKCEDAFTVNRSGKKFKKPFNGTCHYCQERGHFARDCPKRKAKMNTEQRNTQRKGKESARCAEKEKKDGVADHDGDEALHTSDVENKSGWIVDSGATQHMTFERDHLTDYVEFKQPCKVNLGDNRTILAYGKGNYNLVADLDGCTQNISLKEVLYLPDLGKNLLSVRAMVKLGALVTFESDVCKVTRNSKLLALGEMCGKLYMLKVIRGNEEINVAKEDPDLHLWHCRYGHLGMDHITKLVNENMVDGMNTTGCGGDNSTCESCMMGKQHRTVYPKGIPYRATQPFEIVHSDVWSNACKFVGEVKVFRDVYR
jgi:hypothetical protein